MPPRASELSSPRGWVLPRAIPCPYPYLSFLASEPLQVVQAPLPGVPFLPPSSPHHPACLLHVRFSSTSWFSPFLFIFWCSHWAPLHTPLLTGREAPSGERPHLFNFSPVPHVCKTLNKHLLNEWNAPEMCQNLPPRASTQLTLNRGADTRWHELWAFYLTSTFK